MNNTIQHFSRNPKGRDLIVGDIHGHFAKLRDALQAVGFDPIGKGDRLFSVGDLVDRGPESHEAEYWLTNYPWFHAARGNHEEAAIAWAEGTIEKHHYATGFGGGWNINSAPEACKVRAALFGLLPIGIELETELGLVGIVHACCPTATWEDLKTALAVGDKRAELLAAVCTWRHMNRTDKWEDRATDLRAVVVGHTPVERLTQWDRTLFIDTSGWNGGHFTILDAATLMPAECPARGLDWSGA